MDYNNKKYNQEEINEKLRKAKESFLVWSNLSFRQRVLIMKRLKKEIYIERNRIAKILVEDSFRLRFAAEGLIFEVLNTFNIIREAKSILKTKEKINISLVNNKKECYSIYEPIGTICIIVPANAPFFESFQQIIQSIVMGNTIIVKLPDTAHLVAKEIERLIVSSGLPVGVVNIVCGGPSLGEYLVGAKDIDKIVAFGRHDTGKKIVKNASKYVKPMVLGLGDISSSIVLDDCNIDRTVEGLVYGAFCNTGQSCSSMRRVFVLDNISQLILDRVVERTKMIKLKRLDDVDNELSVVNRKEDVKRLKKAIEEAKQEGAVVIPEDYYDNKIDRIKPVIITKVNSQMRVMKEEFIGPYLCFKRVKDINDAINYANNTIYGLSASIWTDNFSKAECLARNLKFGNIWINNTQVYHYLLPYGGYKQSGFGKLAGRDALLEYVNKKLIVIDTSKKKSEFVWFPYTKYKIRLIRKMVEVKHDPSWIKRIISLFKILLNNE